MNSDPTSAALSARDYTVAVHNPDDGVEIAVTVMQPALAAGQSAPLILHGHGFGGSRLAARDHGSIYESLSGGALPSTDAARRAAASGYFVLSFDQRGFGDSGVEGVDIRALLDWAEHEMPHADRLMHRDGRLVAGALGLSYGGAFQLAGALADARFAAVVPTATWHDLRYSLAPDGIIKTVWGASLVALGLPTSGVRLDPLMYRALAQALLAPLRGAGLSPDVAERLHHNSPVAVFENTQAAAASPIAADVLLIQGVGDTLFNLNEALANMHGLQALGRDVHLLVIRHGHSLPFLEDINRIAYETDARLQTGEQATETAALELAYLDWKLKGESVPRALPRVGVVLDDGVMLAFEALPVAQTRDLAFSGQAATGGLDLLQNAFSGSTLGGLARLIGRTADNAGQRLRDWFKQSPEQRDAAETGLIARLINALPARHLDELASGGTFFALHQVSDRDHALVGIPTLELTVEGGGPSPVVFVGVGLEREGELTTRLINDQLRPVRGSATHTIEMNGIAVRLQPGDRIGLLVYGYHPQFLASFSAIPGHVRVYGHLGLPFVSIADHRMA